MRYLRRRLAGQRFSRWSARTNAPTAIRSYREAEHLLGANRANNLESERPRKYDGIMKLHLVYYGPVKSSGNKGQPENKHGIRSALSNQVRAFFIQHCPDVQVPMMGLKTVTVGAHRFVALVTHSMHLQCDLDGLLLTPAPPSGPVKQRGDVDGRKKTIIDGLRIPTEGELEGIAPSSDPIYCLLEDDSEALVVDPHIKVGRLLAPFGKIPDGIPIWKHREDDCLLTLTVSVGATEITSQNMAFLTRG